MPWAVHLHLVMRGHKHYITKYRRDVHKPGSKAHIECACGQKWHE